MKPYYQDEFATIYHADCLETLANLEDSSIDTALNDLPFNYQGGADELVATFGKGKNLYKEFIGQLTDLQFNKIKTGGNLVVLNNMSNLFLTSECYKKFSFRNGIPLIRGHAFYPAWHLGFQHNYIWLLYKEDAKGCWFGSRENHNPNGNALTDVWDDIKYTNGFHYGKTFHPQAIQGNLTQRILLLTAAKGQTVLDPTCGSGTTLVIAKRLGMKSIGIEINEQFAEMTAKRLSQGVFNFTEAIA